MNIWRIHLKSDSQKGIDQRQFCLTNGIVGVGWAIEQENDTLSWEQYSENAKMKYGNINSSVNALKNKIQINDLVWTRDWQGNYFLGRISSDWYYDISNLASEADVVNVRKCDWIKIGTIEAVPGKVVSSFRPPRAVQCIDDETILNFSQIIFNRESGKQLYEITNIDHNIFALISDEDCEDALSIYLQVIYDYFVIPSSCKKDTPNYELELKHKITGKSAVIQVKSGGTSINIDDFNNLDTDVFLFATSGQYTGQPLPNIKTIDPETIETFLYHYIHLLPNKMKIWVDLTRKRH